MSRAALRWMTVRWPRTTEVEQVVGAAEVLASMRTPPTVLETVGEAGSVKHRIAVPENVAVSVRQQISKAVPGIGIELLDARPSARTSRATTVTLSSRRRQIQVDDGAAISAAILVALAAVGEGERLVLQWVLDGVLAPVAVPSNTTMRADSWPRAIAEAVGVGGQRLDAEARRALQAKRSMHGWRAIGRVAVRAASVSRERQLISQVLAALRRAEAPGVTMGLTSTSPSKVAAASTMRWPLRVNVAEIPILAGWPVGDTSALPVSAARHRILAPSRAIPTSGRVMGNSDATSKARPVAIAVDDALRHLHVVGPTGVGKSELILNLVLQDIDAGRAVVLVEPKGDLVTDVLARVPDRRRRDVIVVDPGEEEMPAGLSPLALHGRSPELVADQLLGMFHSMFSSSWGPRTADILGNALITLARTPGMSLPALPALLTNDAFRRRVLAKSDDPLGVDQFWQLFESWSPAERTTAIAPALNKLRPLLVRPALRRIIGQATPKWNLSDALATGKIVLVNLGRAHLGPEGANLLGSLVVSELWQAIVARNRISRSQRSPASVYLDEFAGYLNLGVDLADALLLSRSTGVAWCVAHQHLRQLSPEMAATVMANARSRVAFQVEHEDAVKLAKRGTELTAEDFESLPVHHAYAQLVAGGAVQPWCSIRTVKARAASSSPTAIRYMSARRYGVPAADVDEAIQRTISNGAGAGAREADDISPRRRSGGTR